MSSNRALGYAEILGKLAKITGSMVDKVTSQVAGEETLRAAVWSLAGRAVVAARSAALLSVVNEGWCDMQSVGRTVFECELSIRLLEKHTDRVGKFWEYYAAQMYEQQVPILEAIDREEAVLSPERAESFRQDMERLRPSYEACLTRNQRLRETWFESGYWEAAKDADLRDQYGWWFKTASLFVHATPLSSARFLDREWRDGALRNSSFFASRALALTIAPAVENVFELEDATTVAATGLLVASLTKWPSYAAWVRDDVTTA